LTISLCSYSQKKDTLNKKNPILFFLTFRTFSEVDQIFSLKKKFAPNSYIYNTGLGGTIYIPIIYKRKIHLGIEIGEYYFWNNNIATNSNNETFKRRGQIFPFTLSPSFTLISSKNFGLGINASIGASYNQQINKFADNHAIVTSNFSPMLLVTIKIRVGSSTSLLHNLSLGLGNLYADKRNFRTAGLALPILIPR